MGLGTKLTQSVDRRLYQIRGIGAAIRLRKNVGNSSGFADGANGGAGDNAGTGTGRNELHARGAETAFNDVRNRGIVKTNRSQLASSVLDRFINGRRNFVSFTITPSNLAFTVANDDQSSETETTSALDDRRASTNLYDLVGQTFAAFMIVIAISKPATRAASARAATRP